MRDAIIAAVASGKVNAGLIGRDDAAVIDEAKHPDHRCYDEITL